MTGYYNVQIQLKKLTILFYHYTTISIATYSIIKHISRSDYDSNAPALKRPTILNQLHKITNKEFVNISWIYNASILH